MLVIRPVKKEDIDALEKCALTAGTGLSHLPRKRYVLENKIQHSLMSFAKLITKPEDEEYIFVLAHAVTQEIGGTCSIFAHVGAHYPFKVFRIESLTNFPENLPQPKEKRILQLESYPGNPTEVGGLYLLPEYRKGGLGKLLSLSRFMFIASHLERFFPVVIANMRGIFENNKCPFWDGLGRHFVDLSIDEIMLLRQTQEELIQNALPNHAIYVSLLSPEAQQDISETYVNTKPALSMLLREGFHFTNRIDPFDGGPILSAETTTIRSIAKSFTARVNKVIPENPQSDLYLLANTLLDFRCCYGNLAIENEHLVNISIETADALNLHEGDLIRYINL